MEEFRRHPGVVSLLSFFVYNHLPEGFQAISRPFGELAEQLTAALERRTQHPAELTAGLRKLLEAKDCFVRAQLRAKE
jgi:hypothetical protein